MDERLRRTSSSSQSDGHRQPTKRTPTLRIHRAPTEALRAATFAMRPASASPIRPANIELNVLKPQKLSVFDHSLDKNDGRSPAQVAAARRQERRHWPWRKRLHYDVTEHPTWTGQVLAFNYLWAETRRQRRSFLIGVFTVLLVVFFVALLYNSVTKSPIVFFRVSELQTGEMDVTLSPGAGIDKDIVVMPDRAVPLLNQSVLDVTLAESPIVRGTAPRWVLIAQVVNPTDQQFPATAIVLGVNSRDEDKANLGRGWNNPPLGIGECYISRAILRQIGLQDRDIALDPNVILRLDFVELANLLGTSVPQVNSNVTDAQAAGGLSDAQTRDLLRLLVPTIDDVWDNPVNASTLLGGIDSRAFIGNLILNVTTLLDQSLGGINVDLSNISLDLAPGIPLFNSSDTFINVTRILIDLGLIDANTVDPDATLRELLANISTLVNDQLPNGINIDLSNALVNLTGTNGNGIIDVNVLIDDLVNAVTQAELNLTVGDVIMVAVPLALQSITGVNGARLDFNFRVMGVVDEPEGKWPENLGSIVMVEMEDLFELLQNTTAALLNFNFTSIQLGGIDLGMTTIGGLEIQVPGWPEISIVSVLERAGVSNVNGSLTRAVRDATQAVETLSIREYTMLSIAMYRNRIEAYIGTLNEMKSHMTLFTNDVSDRIGIEYRATFEVPLALALEATIFIRYFLDNIFGSTIFLIVILGILLIYSLLLNDVEGKTYEYGMLRALGMRHDNLIQILVTKSIMFAIPGLVLGIVLAMLINVPVENIIADYADIETDYGFASFGIITVIVLAFVMPLVANIIPIRRALSRTLRDSLDIYHAVVGEVNVTMHRLEDYGLDLWQTFLAVFVIVVGFVTFYILPYAFTFREIPLFLSVLNGILLMMLFGLCIVSQTVQPYLERAVVHMMLAFHHQHLVGVVKKNLSGHRSRNKKTALMFVISLAFVIFAGVMLALQSASLGNNIKVIFGADIMVRAPSSASDTDRLREAEMRAYMNGEIARRQAGELDAVVQSFTFVTFDLRRLFPVDEVRVLNLPSFPNRVVRRAFGVEQNYLQVIYDEFYLATEFGPGQYRETPSGKDDAVDLMFRDKGNARLSIERLGLQIPPPITAGININQFAVPLDEDPRFVNASELTGRTPIEAAYLDYIDIIVGENTRDFGAFDTDTPLKLAVKFQNQAGNRWFTYLAKARAMVRKVPGFFFSSYLPTVGLSPALIPMPEFDRMYSDAVHNRQDNRPLESAPKQKMLVRVTPGATAQQRSDLISGIKTFFVDDRTLALDAIEIIDTLDEAVTMMQLFFSFVGLIAMIMCFFILWLSFTANVSENAWEFGVLRSIGLNQYEVVLVYVYEALALVLSSLLLGTLIGVVIAASLTAQFNLFSEMPFVMDFPVGMFLALVLMAISVAVLGSYVPARAFLDKSISNVLRRT